MALTVTFTGVGPTSAGLPVMAGATADTEEIAVGASSTQGTKAASKDRPVASLLAGEDCWIAIGANPTAVAASGRKLLAGQRLELWCGDGDIVAVIQA